jgi:hypothetical protein
MQGSTTPAAPIVAQPALGSVTLDQLRQVFAQMLAEQPDHEQRLIRAANIVAIRHIDPTPTGAWVQSETDPTIEYFVTRGGQCNCPDATRRGSTCKHALAVALYQRCERVDAETTDPTLRPIAYALTPQALAQLDEHR